MGIDQENSRLVNFVDAELGENLSRLPSFLKKLVENLALGCV